MRERTNVTLLRSQILSLVPNFFLIPTKSDLVSRYGQCALRKPCSAKIGENISVAAVANFGEGAHLYLHRRASDLPPQVGVLVEYTGDDALAHQTALHIAAMSPQWVIRDEVPADLVENERRIAEATAKEEGKPEAALPRIVEGRVGGFFKDVVLVDQAAVWEDKKTVGQSLADGSTEVARFVRFAVGA